MDDAWLLRVLANLTHWPYGKKKKSCMSTTLCVAMNVADLPLGRKGRPTSSAGSSSRILHGCLIDQRSAAILVPTVHRTWALVRDRGSAIPISNKESTLVTPSFSAATQFTRSLWGCHQRSPSHTVPFRLDLAWILLLVTPKLGIAENTIELIGETNRWSLHTICIDPLSRYLHQSFPPFSCDR